MSYILEKDRQAQWDQVREQGHASEGRQPRRIWAVEALKPILLPEEWEAGNRAVRECAAATGVNPRTYDERTDGGGGSDYGLAARVDAARCLNGLRQAALTRTRASRAPQCVEWIASMWTLAEIARELGYTRRTAGREKRVIDTRPARPFVRLVLIAMAEYYLDCDGQLSHWRGLDGALEHQHGFSLE